MAKGRRLTTSRSERLLGSYSTFSNGQSTPGSGTDSSELGEEDIWSIVDDGEGERNENLIINSSQGDWSPRGDVVESNGRGGGRRRLPRDDQHTTIGGLSLAFDESTGGKTVSQPRIVHQFRSHDSVAGGGGGGGGGAASSRHMATSAPLNVPDWSKILRVDSVDSLHALDDGFDDHESEMVPPHEYLAREYARRKKMGGASVFEGVGRTLKGRDLRRVRDAVWSQTGFDG
ncbi:protein S40-5-like [Euphorbia lathyris]|uniref:protein S40-5-like n=1 Tax=Euphorbia lathyris TaxID=212925 RepID=UPI0033137A6E